MKLSWGTGIVITMGTFMSLILFFVFKVQTDNAYDNELVLENYYQYESNLDKMQDSERNAKLLTQKLSIDSNSDNISISFPQNFDYSKISGNISLYRPSDQKLDFEIPISLSSSNLLIPRKILVDGRWDILINWKYEDKEYFSKQSLNLTK